MNFVDRFYYEGMWRQKLQTMVDFPLRDMDMSPYTIGPKPSNSYNLYAVSNHIGTLDGGHCKYYLFINSRIMSVCVYVCVCYWISSLDTASNLAKFTRKKDANFLLTLIYFRKKSVEN